MSARHGFAQGPVQVIADAAGYSKAAVLKCFGSKERIQAAVVARTEEHITRVAAAAAGLPVGKRRDAALFNALVEMIEEWPGTGALIVGAFWLTRDPEILERLAQAQERRVRVVSAIGAVTSTLMANRDTRWTE